MCQYCREYEKDDIKGKEIKVNKTTILLQKNDTDNLSCFIMKGKEDKKAGIMIGTYEGFHYIDINYCPMCGRQLGGNNER